MQINKPTGKKVQVRKPKSFFALVIGDYGAILIFGKGDTLEMRNYLPDASEKNIENLKDIISADSNSPLYILIDVLDQSYNIQSLPAVNALSIGGLVKNRLERDFPESSLKGSLFIDRNTTGRRDWNYLFVSTPYTSPVSDWVEAIISLPNHLRSIGLLPVESEVFFSKLNKIIYPKVKSPYTIQMLVIHTKVGGIRQVVFKNGRIIFSRLVTVENIEDEDVVAGQFEQEIQNTIQYLSRISKSNEKVEVFIVCASSIKASLANNKEFHIFTPYELSVHFGFKNAVMQNDKFADIVFAMLYCNSKPVLPFNTKHTKLLTTLHTIHKVNKTLSIIFCLIMAVVIGRYVINTSSMDSQIKSDQLKLSYIQNQIESRKRETKIDESESLKIMEVTSIYLSLVEDKNNPIHILERISKAIENDAIIKNYEWKIGNTQVVQQHNLPTGLNTGNIEAIFGVNFINTGSSYQELFTNFDNFIKKIENEFQEYQVEYTRITQQITFQESKQQIPINITLRGPKL